MENEDTKREIPGRERRGSSNTLTRAVSEVVNGCERLMAAIDNHDFEDVEHAACQAANMWLAAHAAHRRLGHRAEGTASADGVSSLFEARTTLLDLFTRAKAEIAVPGMHLLLDELRGTLTAADAESAAEGTHHS